MKKINISAGCRIEQTIERAIKEAAKLSDTVEFDFNGVTVQVAAHSDKDLIYRDWQRGMLRKSDTFTVSPYPAKDLLAEELAEDERLQKEIEERRQAMRREYEREQKEKEMAMLAVLCHEEINLSEAGKEKWQAFADNNLDPYGAAVVRYAENWARLMQAKLKCGARLEDIAEASSGEADTEGISGFMYGAAVSMLSQCWIHGEGLRVWHNLKTQVGNEGEKANKSGGVLNPALLHIGN